jgi:hypothetical protein
VGKVTDLSQQCPFVPMIECGCTYYYYELSKECVMSKRMFWILVMLLAGLPCLMNRTVRQRDYYLVSKCRDKSPGCSLSGEKCE